MNDRQYAGCLLATAAFALACLAIGLGAWWLT